MAETKKKKAIQRLIRGDNGQLGVVLIDLETLQPVTDPSQYVIVSSSQSAPEPVSDVNDPETPSTRDRGFSGGSRGGNQAGSGGGGALLGRRPPGMPAPTKNVIDMFKEMFSPAPKTLSPVPPTGVVAKPQVSPTPTPAVPTPPAAIPPAPTPTPTPPNPNDPVWATPDPNWEEDFDKANALPPDINAAPKSTGTPPPDTTPRTYEPDRSAPTGNPPASTRETTFEGTPQFSVEDKPTRETTFEGTPQFETGMRDPLQEAQEEKPFSQGFPESMPAPSFRDPISAEVDKALDDVFGPGTAERTATNVLSERLTAGAKDRGSDYAISNLQPEFRQALADFIEATPPDIKENLQIGSAFRSVPHQASLYKSSGGSGMVGSPTGSKHVHGQAVDLYYKGQRLDHAPKEVRDWLHQNAPNFGLNFPMNDPRKHPYENWHIEHISARTGLPWNPPTAPTPTPNPNASYLPTINPMNTPYSIPGTPQPKTPEGFASAPKDSRPTSGPDPMNTPYSIAPTGTVKPQQEAFGTVAKPQSVDPVTLANATPAQMASLGYITRTPEQIASISRMVAGEMSGAQLRALEKGNPEAIKEFTNIMTTVENRAASQKYKTLENALTARQYNSLSTGNAKTTNFNYSQFGPTLANYANMFYQGALTPADWALTSYHATYVSPEWSPLMSNTGLTGSHYFGSLPDYKPSSDFLDFQRDIVNNEFSKMNNLTGFMDPNSFSGGAGSDTATGMGSLAHQGLAASQDSAGLGISNSGIAGTGSLDHQGVSDNPGTGGFADVSTGPSPSSPAGGAQAASSGPSSSSGSAGGVSSGSSGNDAGAFGSTSSGGSYSSSGPSPSSPAGGAQAAGGYTDGSKPSSSSSSTSSKSSSSSSYTSPTNDGYASSGGIGGGF